jgi:adenylate kinase
MGSVHIVVGLSGVGKSTVIEKALESSESAYQLINYGDRMLELATDRDLVEDRDEMKNIERSIYKEIQIDAAELIADESNSGDVIVDTHAAIKSPFGYVPGLPKWTLETLEPETITMIDIDSEEIVERRAEDTERDREDDSVEAIEEYRGVVREMAASGAMLTGAYFEIIRNEEGKADEAADQLAETLDQ